MALAKSNFSKATRKRSKLRLAMDGPAGSGKSFTALRFAFSFAQLLGREPKVAAIDTEHESLSKYVGENPDGIPFDFDCAALTKHSPSEYTARIIEAGQSGFDVLVIDSLSHAWEGVEGALELVDKNRSANRFTAWKDVTPMHRRMVEAILSSPCHVIVTMRTKTEYVLEEDERGKKVPRKIGIKPIQRDGMEYEFDVYASLDWSHIMTVTKSRCRAVDGAITVRPGATFMEPVLKWLSEGVAVPEQQQSPQLLGGGTSTVSDDGIQALLDAGMAAGYSIDQIKAECLKRYSVREIGDLTPRHAEDLTKRLASKKKTTTDNGSGKLAADPAAVSANGDSGDGNSSNGGSGKKVAKEEPTTQTAGTGNHDVVTKEQLEMLAELRSSLWEVVLPDGSKDDKDALWQSILAKRNVTTAKALTQTQAKDLISKLRTQIDIAAMQDGLNGGAAEKDGSQQEPANAGE